MNVDGTFIQTVGVTQRNDRFTAKMFFTLFA